MSAATPVVADTHALVWYLDADKRLSAVCWRRRSWEGSPTLCGRGACHYGRRALARLRILECGEGVGYGVGQHGRVFDTCEPHLCVVDTARRGVRQLVA